MNALVLQCGGPSAVVNASLWGVISAWQETARNGHLWGARNGIQGLTSGDWLELTSFQNRKAAPLELQPGAALGSGRDRLVEDAMPGILDRLRNYGIETVFFIGGNGSMAAAQKLNQFTQKPGLEIAGKTLKVIGIPKTIDNDLNGIDFSPGYGSAARFIAQTTYDISLDLVSMRRFDDVAVMEVMGRHVGWLAAASALGNDKSGTVPQLILLPEVLFDEVGFLVALQQQHRREGICLVVASEGIRDEGGKFLAEKNQPASADSSGQKLLSLTGGVASYLSGLVVKQLGLACRQIRPDTIQRSCSSMVSKVDRNCAFNTGRWAVLAALEEVSGVMIGLERQAGEWNQIKIKLSNVVNHEKPLPLEYIADGFGVTNQFLSYARPLIDNWKPEKTGFFT